MEAARLTDTRKNEARRPAATRTSGAKAGSAHVLLVDDDASLLRLLGMRLESRGYRVTTAESGSEALRRLEAERPDIVLSDLRMDEMDGLALFQAIQREVPGDRKSVV